MGGTYLDVGGARALEVFLPELHKSFGAGQPFDAYRRYLAERLDHPWAREGLRTLVLRDEQRGYLSHLRLHAVRALHRDAEIWLGGIEAVCTPEPLRRQGHASEALKLTLDLLRQEGVDGAYLFSDVGARFYERLGFVVVGATMADLPISALPALPNGSVPVRAATQADEPAIRKLHYRAGAGQPLLLERDDRRWDYLLSRWIRRPAHFAGDDTRLIGCVVAPGNAVLAYALARARGGVLKMLEFGMEAPDERLFAALLGWLRAQALASGCSRFVAPRPPGTWGILFETRFPLVPRPDGIFMVTGLSHKLDVPALAEYSRGYWETDHI